MDATEIRNRTVSTLIAAFGAAATTASFLYMFQDSADTALMQKQTMLKHNNQQQNGKNGEGASTDGPIAAGIPKVGDASMLFPDFVGGLNGFASKARSLNASGMGWFDNMGTPVLVLTKPEHIKFVLNKVTAHALWGGIKPASEAFFGRSVLFVLEGEEWKRLRGILRDSFKMQRLDVLSKDVTSCALTLANRLQEFADEGKAVDMNSAFAMYHLASVGKSSFNFDMDVMQKFPKTNDIADSFEFLLQELPRRSFHPDSKTREDYESGTEENVKWQRAAKTVRKVVMQTVIRRLEEEQQTGYTPRGDLLDSMIAAYRASSNEAKSQETKRAAEIMMDAMGDNLVEIFFAGYNTSVVGMSVALYHLALDRQLMREAQMEIDAIIPDDVEIGTSLNAKQFPFLCRVFQESLRLVPPAPLVARQTTEPLTLDETKINSGTVVWFPAAFMHKDPQAWGSTVDEFDPSRWEKPIVPGSYLPFSGGARDCLGKHFAELESVVALAVLLKTFDFEIDSKFKFMPLFTGFGYRTANANNMQVSMNLIPKRRTDVSAFIYDWTPVRIPRRSSNPLLADMDDDLPKPPKFS